MLCSNEYLNVRKLELYIFELIQLHDYNMYECKKYIFNIEDNVHKHEITSKCFIFFNNYIYRNLFNDVCFNLAKL